MRTPLGVIIFIAFMLLLDTYFFQAIKSVALSASPKTRTVIYGIYWALTIIAVAGFLLFIYSGRNFWVKKYAHSYLQRS